MTDNPQDSAVPVSVSVAPNKKLWYVVHAYSGMEKSVQRALAERITRAGMDEKFGQILVPTEEVIEMKNGHKSVTERRFFPGYVLVEMEMTDETWHLVKNTNKVTGFIGGKSNKPTPIPPHEVDKIMTQMQEGVEKPVLKCSMRWASWSGLKMAHLPISTAMSKKSITKNRACACQ